MKDIIGNIIHVGDLVAYPVRQGSATWQTVGKVLGYTANGGLSLLRYQTNHTLVGATRGTVLRRQGVGRCVVVKQPSLSEIEPAKPTGDTANAMDTTGTNEPQLHPHD